MPKKKPEVEEVTTEECCESSEWKEAFEHAVKATREAFTAAAEATAELLRQGGKLAEQTMGEAQRTLIVSVDAEITEVLDKMVAAGVHKSRGEAARHLIKQGITASGDMLARIDKVQTQIDELRDKMREIPLEGEA
jgi:hypothetical protein